MRLVAIDPGSKSTGVAVFDDGILKETRRLIMISEDPRHRRVQMARLLDLFLDEKNPDHVVCEEPQIQGVNGNYMHRLLGSFEFLCHPNLSYFHPATVKKSITGTGKAEKLEVALEAGKLLATDTEQEILANLIAREAFDETDAVAVGLTYLMSKIKQ